MVSVNLCALEPSDNYTVRKCITQYNHNLLPYRTHIYIFFYLPTVM